MLPLVSDMQNTSEIRYSLFWVVTQRMLVAVC